MHKVRKFNCYENYQKFITDEIDKSGWHIINVISYKGDIVVTLYKELIQAF